MSTNHYFNNIRAANEQNVIEDLTVEAIKIHGMDVYYLPRTQVNTNKIFGEDPISRFSGTTQIEMYLENVNGFEGPQDLLSKFGLQVKDSASFLVSKKRFQKETGMARPLEGDIIYLPMTKGLFEIKYVEHENPFFQLGKNYVFKLSVELFQFSEETFATGEEDIDVIAKDLEYSMYITTGSGTGSFAIGDEVYQFSNGTITGDYTDADATAVVKDINGTQLVINQIVGNWQATSSLITRYVTVNSNAAYKTVTGISDTVDANAYSDNSIIQTKADEALDTRRTNLFGTP